MKKYKTLQQGEKTCLFRMVEKCAHEGKDRTETSGAIPQKNHTVFTVKQPALQTNIPQLLLHQLQQPPSPIAHFKIHKAKKNLSKVQEDKEARQLSAKRKGNVHLPAP